MQKQPYESFKIQYSEMPLPDDFPVVCYVCPLGDQNLSHLHFHNGVELGYCRSGTGIFCIDRQLHSFYPRDVTVIFSDQPHIAQGIGKNPSNWDFMSIDAEKLLRDVEPAHSRTIIGLLNRTLTVPGLIHYSSHKEISRLIRLLFDEFYVKGPVNQMAVKALIWALFTKLAEIAVEKKDAVSDDHDSYSAIAPAVNFITNHYQQPISVEKLAADCYLSPTHFRRLFKAVMGCSPMEYLTRSRIKMASSLLRTTKLPITEIAFCVGYQNISSFNRCFRALCGCCPREYRRKYT